MKHLGEIKIGKRLSDEEMKKIVGGYRICFRGKKGSQTLTYFIPSSKEQGDAWCDVWIAFGYDCVCGETDSPFVYC